LLGVETRVIKTSFMQSMMISYPTKSLISKEFSPERLGIHCEDTADILERIN
jgi:hypothetical protein